MSPSPAFAAPIALALTPSSVPPLHRRPLHRSPLPHPPPAFRRAVIASTSPAPPPIKPTTLSASKAALLAHIAPLSLGRAVLDDAAAQATVEALIHDLEPHNPTPRPADAPLRAGRWRLLYTNSPIVLGRSRPGFAAPEKCWQVVDMADGAAEGRVRNEEEGVVKFGPWEWRWRNRIVGKVKSLRGDRFRLKFERFLIGGWFNVAFPGPIIGWQDQTFLDDQLRIAWTHLGNVFVMEKEEDE